MGAAGELMPVISVDGLLSYEFMASHELYLQRLTTSRNIKLMTNIRAGNEVLNIRNQLAECKTVLFLAGYTATLAYASLM